MSFKVTLDVTAESEEHITGWAVSHLQRLGYHVAAPNEKWETPTELMRRIGLSKSETLHASIKVWAGRGRPVPTHRTATGRLMELVSNPDFDAFCRRNKR